MEPTILLLGRNLEVMNILKSELEKFGRKILYANSIAMIDKCLAETQIDLAVVGAGLPDETRNEMGEHLQQIKSDLPVFMIERSSQGGPAKMIDFTNEKAVMWKIGQVLGKPPVR